MKAEKARANRHTRKERVAYVETDKNNQEIEIVFECVEEKEVNLEELKLVPPYVCKFLRPSNGKSLVEPSKNEKFITKTYTFDVTKCDEIYDLLLADGQIIVSIGLKTSALEQIKKKGFYKYPNFLGHKTSQCVLFRDFVKISLKDGRLKYGDK